MHVLLLFGGLLLAGVGLWTAALATADPSHTKRTLIVLSAVLVALGTVVILVAISRLVERFA